jgi:uncharacterized membrane protein YedE/YeeE
MNTITESIRSENSTIPDVNARTERPTPYWNPYKTGVVLGLVLLSAFLIMGRGLGASGAFTTSIAYGLEAMKPGHASGNQFFREYMGENGGGPLGDWIVIEVLGVFVGGMISGALAGRTKKTVEKGRRISVRNRIVYAFFGGLLMGVGSKLARGCTSGQGLTGGALLNVGSWVFMIALFAGAYAVAYLFRRQWT